MKGKFQMQKIFQKIVKVINCVYKLDRGSTRSTSAGRRGGDKFKLKTLMVPAATMPGVLQ